MSPVSRYWFQAAVIQTTMSQVSSSCCTMSWPCWIPSPLSQPFGLGRLVVYTPKRVVVLEERGGKLRTLAEYPTHGRAGMIPFGAGRFLLVWEGKSFVLLGLKDARLRPLANSSTPGPSFCARAAYSPRSTSATGTTPSRATRSSSRERSERSEEEALHSRSPLLIFRA